MGKIRVLVVDDSVLVRKVLTDVLAEDPSIELVGSAANGKIALQKIPQCNPDIITLDIEMPEMNGIETVRKIRESYPKLPIVMVSALTERGASATFEAMSAGATDYITKPSSKTGLDETKAALRNELLRKILTLGDPSPRRSPEQPVRFNSTPTNVPSTAVGYRPVSSQRKTVNIVAIGVSTGGPNALADLLPHLPGNFPVPIVIVQHMPPVFTRLLAERLSAKCKLQAVEASSGQMIKAGTIYIAPGDFHLELVRNGNNVETVLNQGPPENSCRPAVDCLFRSVARVYGSGTLGIVLTGMGQDGLRGCEVIREVGGQVIVQDSASSVVWGMPGAVADAGLAERILPLSEIPGEILLRSARRVG